MTGESRTPPVRMPHGADPDIVDELTKLVALRDRGALTDGESEDQKRKLLDR